jgi:hypothetical protein
MVRTSDLNSGPQNFYLHFNAVLQNLERKLTFLAEEGIVFMKLNLEEWARNRHEQYGTLDLLKNLLEDVR